MTYCARRRSRLEWPFEEFLAPIGQHFQLVVTLTTFDPTLPHTVGCDRRLDDVFRSHFKAKFHQGKVFSHIALLFCGKGEGDLSRPTDEIFTTEDVHS